MTYKPTKKLFEIMAKAEIRNGAPDKVERFEPYHDMIIPLGKDEVAYLSVPSSAVKKFPEYFEVMKK